MNHIFMRQKQILSLFLSFISVILLFSFKTKRDMERVHDGERYLSYLVLTIIKKGEAA